MEKNTNSRSIIGKRRNNSPNNSNNVRSRNTTNSTNQRRVVNQRPQQRPVSSQRINTQSRPAARTINSSRARQQENVRKLNAIDRQETPVIAKKRTPLIKNKLIKFLLILLFILLFLFFSVILYAKFGNLNPGLSGNIGLYNISTNAAAVASSNRIVNIAIFGVDGRDDVEGDRSDSIIIGTADFEHNKLKLTSLMRDTYVDIAGEDRFDKLNAAYSEGGPLESLRTINENFDMAITDYVVIDFSALVAVVNSVGGVDIEITSEDELYWLNQYLMDVNDKVGTADPFVEGTGVQHLTGSQALAYARIRYVGNGDYERTQRQRNVLSQVVARATSLNIFDQINLIKSVLPYIETSLSFSEMVKIGINFLMMSDRELEQFRLPTDDYSSDGYLHGVSYVFPNTLVDNIKAWYQFIYEIDYTPSSTAREISEEIQYAW